MAYEITPISLGSIITNMYIGCGPLPVIVANEGWPPPSNSGK